MSEELSSFFVLYEVINKTTSIYHSNFQLSIKKYHFGPSLLSCAHVQCSGIMRYRTFATGEGIVNYVLQMKGGREQGNIYPLSHVFFAISSLV